MPIQYSCVTPATSRYCIYIVASSQAPCLLICFCFVGKLLALSDDYRPHCGIQRHLVSCRHIVPARSHSRSVDSLRVDFTDCPCTDLGHSDAKDIMKHLNTSNSLCPSSSALVTASAPVVTAKVLHLSPLKCSSCRHEGPALVTTKVPHLSPRR
jgi:hypothetical protein